MKNSIVLVLAFLLVPFASAAHADFFFAASLDEAQSGGTGSAATGTAMLTLNDAMTELTMTILFDGITTADITAFHIHAAPAGTPGPVVFGLVSPNHDEDGDFMDLGDGFFSQWDDADSGETLASQLTNLFNEGLYFNMHTAAFPSGEIRGQITSVIPEPTTTGLLALCVFGFVYRRRS